MAKLPDDTAFGAIDAGMSGRPIASFDTAGYSRGAAAMAQGVKDIGAGLEKAGKEVQAAALQQEKQKALAAFNEAKANADYLTRTQKLRAGLEHENDPSKLAAYKPYFQAANETRKAFFANPEYASKWAQNRDEEAKSTIASRFDAVTREQMIETTNATLRQLHDAARQSSGDETTRLIDSATGVIHGLRATNQIDDAAAREMQQSWAERYAADWFLAQPAESRVAMLRAKSAAVEVPLGTDGQAAGPVAASTARNVKPSAAPASAGTPIDFLPKEKWPDLLLAAQQEVDRGAVARSVERTDVYRQNIAAARDGKLMLPDRGAIELDPDVTPAVKNMLLQEHAAAKEAGELYTRGSQNDARATWNAGDARDRKALEVVDQWGGVVAGVQAADPKSAGVAAHRFAETGMVSDGVKGSIKGLVRGGSDQQLDYAMTLLGDLSRRNPNAFLHAFDKDTVRTLTAWQNRGEQAPAAFREMLQRASDPAQAKAREAWEAEGRKLARSVSDHALLSVHADPNGPGPTKPVGGIEAPAMAMHREAWNALFAEGFASSDGNPDAAKQYADRMIQAEWAVSPSGGGRLMRNAPETMPSWILPTVDGSRDWMKHQVDAALSSYTSGRDVWDRVPAHGLVALPTTGAEIATLNADGTLPDGRRSPTWGLVYVDPATDTPAMVPFAFDVENAGTAGAFGPRSAEALAGGQTNGGGADPGGEKIGLWERTWLNARDSYYRNTLRGSGELALMAAAMRMIEAGASDDELLAEFAPALLADRANQKGHRRATLEWLRSTPKQYKEVIADLKHYDAMGGFGSRTEAIAALLGQVGGSIPSPESLLGWSAKAGTWAARAGKAALQQAGISIAVDPLVQMQSVAAGSQEKFDTWRMAASGVIGGLIGGGLHVGGASMSKHAPSARPPEEVTRFDAFELGGSDPSSNRKIVQGASDVHALREGALQRKPILESDLQRIAAGIDGAQFVSARVKDAPGLEEKVATGRPANTIGDVLGGRISVESPVALKRARDEIEKTYRTLEVDDKIADPPRGYRAVHMQVDLGNGMSAEVQLVPSEIAKVMDSTHGIYDKYKRFDKRKMSHEQNAAYQSDMELIRSIHDKAWVEQERLGWSKSR